MVSDIVLREGKFSKSFNESFTRYYSTTVDNKAYAEHKLSEWAKSQTILIYVAEKGNDTVGWIIFNPDHSNIEEVLLKEEWHGKEIESHIFDALIHKESLISAKILREDRSGQPPRKTTYHPIEGYHHPGSSRFLVNGLECV